MPRKPKRKLTEAEWSKVFELRCRSKRGEYLSPEDRKLVDAAYKEDPDRYAELEGPVFNATVPFGSQARWGERKK